MNAVTEARYIATLDDKFTVEEGTVYLSGMQALLRLMLDQRRADARRGLRTAGLVTGYPGSPVGGVDDVMLRNKKIRDAHHIVFQPGLNEELAATAVWGSQMIDNVPGARWDGVFGMWYGKSPGLDRAADALHHANYRGVHRNGGVLAVVGDDPHARSTIYPSDSNLAFQSFYMPVLAPGNIQEVLDLGLHGFAMSRAAGVCVGFKLVTDVADSAATARVSPDRIVPDVPRFEYEGKPLEPKLLLNETGGRMLETEQRLHDGRMELVLEYARRNGINRVVADSPRSTLGLVAAGKTYYDLREALRILDIDDKALERLGIRILKMGMISPVDPSIVREFAQGLEEIFVIEDKRPLIELYIKDALFGAQNQPRVIGKRDQAGQTLLPAWGELSADVIAGALRGLLQARGAQLKPLKVPFQLKATIPVLPFPGRASYFCSGCPHNSSLRLPEGAVGGGGIGCHIMGVRIANLSPLTGYTQMGGEGAQWIGLAPFTDTTHFFQNLGDGTFHHSGSLAIRAAIAAGTNITYKLLYNHTVAMTGGQDVTGSLSVDQIIRLLDAEGVRRIIITTEEPERYAKGRAGTAEVWHRDRLVEAQEVLAKIAGVTVLLHDQHCAAEKRRLRKRGKMADRPTAAFINTRVCEGCGDCGAKSNCLSVQPVATEFGRKTQIHQSSCNQDLSCLNGDCPSFLTVRTKDGKRPQQARATAMGFPVDREMPLPDMVAPASGFNAAFVGIGGTGVVTVNQILGTAAFLDGYQVQTYDNTGSSQKAGPVVSHLKLLSRGEEGSPTVSNGAADLYLAFDELGAVNPANLSLLSAERTRAVVSTSAVPTGDMVSNLRSQYPAQSELSRRIDGAGAALRNVYIDAQSLAEKLMGDHMASNLLMVGVAWQLGSIPISLGSIEAAIRLNGTSVRTNLDAFQWGRLWVTDRAAVSQLMEAPGGHDGVPQLSNSQRARQMAAESITASADTLALVANRVDELIAYQDERYAKGYLAFLRKVSVVRPGDEALLTAVARNLYKLFAYKDEYEVARLHLGAAAHEELRATFGDEVRYEWNFHPTFLRSLGVRKKLRLGPWFRPALACLRSMKALRGTHFDLFGMTKVRRMERALPAFYMELMEAALGRNEISSTALLALAESPDAIRGYEDVKERNVGIFMAQVDSFQRQSGLSVAVPPALLPAMPAAATAPVAA